MIKISIEQLKQLVERLENQKEYGDMESYVYLSVNQYPNGRKYAEFEQPCNYAECANNYYRYEEEK